MSSPSRWWTKPSVRPSSYAQIRRRTDAPGVRVSYGPRTAVEPLDLDLPAGVVAGFVGPNGAGKTTTTAMLLGLVRLSGGTGTALGVPITEPFRYLPRVGALIETPAFYPALSGIENLRMFAAVAGHRPSAIPELLDVVVSPAVAPTRSAATRRGSSDSASPPRCPATRNC